ncbi:MAG TPA: DUF3810 family protein [Vicinamibacterales bacterium]|nr:DUF3810 family protein [Vicinamibacterales bacterium]
MGRVLKFFVLLTAAVIALLQLPRGAVEQLYSRGVYPYVQPRLTSLTNRTAFAWFDAMLVISTCTIVLLWCVRLRRRKKGVWRTLGGLVVETAAIGAVLYLWFLAAWGLNYRREPLRAQLDFHEDRITRENLRNLARRNVESLNSLHKEAHTGGWPELAAVPGALAPAFDRAQQDLGMAWRAEPGLPKRSLLNFYFTRVSVDGMTDPFFLETLANQSLLPFERAATVAHEWSHLAGYADESEANFLGWLVCMRGSASDRYSGWLSLYFTVTGSLPRADREEISRTLAPGPRADLQAIRDRVQRQMVPVASRAGYALYDRYLKANRVEAGLRSYAEVIRLLLGTKFNEDGSPVLRR